MKQEITIGPEKDAYIIEQELPSEDSDSETLIPETVSTANLQYGSNVNSGRALLVNSHGIKWIRLPKPSSQLEIEITHAHDDSLAYKSVRPKRNSDDATLGSAEGKPLVQNSYSPVPGKPAKIAAVDQLASAPCENNSFLKISQKITTRTIKMTDQRSGMVFTWRYLKTKSAGAEGKTDKNLVLTVQGGNAGPAPRIIAQLLRDDKNRTPGTKRRDAGAGGRLEFDELADALMPEPLIVATCLMMLREEIQRRRVGQFMVLAAASGHGGG